jgi:hypothetical protein
MKIKGIQRKVCKHTLEKNKWIENPESRWRPQSEKKIKIMFLISDHIMYKLQ